MVYGEHLIMSDSGCIWVRYKFLQNASPCSHRYLLLCCLSLILLMFSLRVCLSAAGMQQSVEPQAILCLSNKVKGNQPIIS